MANKVNLYCDVNLTPVRGPNPEWTPGAIVPQWIQNSPCHDLMKTCGFREMFMIYDGTVNRANDWIADDGSFSDSDHIDWSKDGNYSNPPVESVIRKICKAPAGLPADATHPQRMFPWAENTELHIPIIFDLENSSMGVGLDSPEIDRVASIQRFTDLAFWAKTTAPYSPIGIYGVPPMSNGDVLITKERLSNYAEYHSLMQETAKYLDFAAPFFYNWDLSAAAPSSWFNYVDLTTRILDQYFSYLPRVAVINPLYQIYNPTYWKQVAGLNNKPVPIGLWKKQCQYLVDRNYDIFLWTGNGSLKDCSANILATKNFGR